jgi:PAS domain S-box-containing protein
MGHSKTHSERVELEQNITHSAQQGGFAQQDQSLYMLAETLHEAIVVFTGNFQITYTNPAFDSIFEISGALAKKDNSELLKVFHPKDQDKIKEFLASERNQPVNNAQLTCRVINQQGSIKWLSINKYALPGTLGKPPLWAWVVFDITSRKQDELQLEKHEDDLESQIKQQTEEQVLLQQKLKTTQKQFDKASEKIEKLNLRLSEEHELKQRHETLERLVDERSKELNESEERYRSLSEAAFEAIAVTIDKKIIEVNDQFLKMMGYNNRDEVIGLHMSNMITPESLEEVYKAVDSQYEKPYFIWSKRRDGSIFPSDTIGRTFNYKGQKARVSSIRDISYRFEAEKALKKSERKFRDIFTNSSDGIIISDLRFNILEANTALIEMIGISYEQSKYINKMDLIIPMYRQLIYDRFQTLLAGEDVPNVEIEIYTSEKKKIQVELNSRLIDYEGTQAVMNIVRDIRARKEMEHRLFDTIVETEEKERARFAADLHDEVGPLLSSLRLYLTSFQESTDNSKKDFILEQAQLLVKEAIGCIREMSNDLSPHILNNYGLSAAIKATIDKALPLIPVSFDTNIEKQRFIPIIEIVYYRIFKELVNNTIKHANARAITCSLVYENEYLNLQYTDDGKGFDLTKLLENRSRGMGIFNILSRIKTINASHQLYTAEGQGFSLGISTKVQTIS